METEQVAPEAGSPLALRLTESRVLTTKLRRIDREGALVTGLPHPPVVQPGRQLELAWHDGGRWRMLPVAVAASQVGGHVDAGFLRLSPLPETPEQDAPVDVVDDAPAPDDASPAATKTTPEASRPLRKAGDVPPVGSQVALRLASGRVLNSRVHALDDSAIVLGLPHPSALAEGTLLEIAWSVGPKWYSLSSSVATAGEDGRLRLLPARAASEQKNRRSEPRYRLVLGVRVRVEKQPRAASRERASSQDRGRQPGRRLLHGGRRSRGRGHPAADDARSRGPDRKRHQGPRRARNPSPGLGRHQRRRRVRSPARCADVGAAPAHLVAGVAPAWLRSRDHYPVAVEGGREMSALPLVLASRSPQRRAILTQLALPYRVVEPDYDERALPLDAIELVETHARGKARSVDREPDDGAVLGVDTAVVIDDDVLGKPVDSGHAREMLERLAGREHLVVSGLTLRHGDARSRGTHRRWCGSARSQPPSSRPTSSSASGRGGQGATRSRGGAQPSSNR